MKLKRLLIALMASSMAAGSLPLTAFAANFTDIDDVPWEGAKTYINSVADAGLMVGDYNMEGQLVFRARDKVSYCETMQLVYALMKNYTGNSVDQGIIDKYKTVMNGYKIPEWAHECVAYGLENGIVTISDIPGFITSSGTQQSATRQDVAIMVGRSLKSIENVNSNVTLSFNDSSSVASVAVPYVDLLNRLGIITGDDNNNFNPKNYINRAEMAVVVSKTYDFLNSKKSGGSNTGTSTQSGSITGTVTTAEAVGSNIVLNIDTGSETKAFSGSATTTCLSGLKTITLAEVNVGDKVLVSYEGGTIKSVVVTEPVDSGDSETTETSVKGDFSDMSRSEITIKVDGSKKSYDFDDVKYVKFYYEGDSKDYSEFNNKVQTGDTITLQLDDDGYVIEVKATENDDKDYDKEGYLDRLNSSSIEIKTSKTSSSSKEYDFKNESKSSVSFYIGSKEKDYDEFKDEVEEDDKIGLMFNSDDEVIEVYLLDDDEDDDEKDGYFYDMSSEYIRIKSSKSADSKKYYYEDDDKDNVKFYIDDEKESYSTFKDEAEEDDKITLKLNDDGEVIKAYLTTDDSDDEDYDETGYFESIKSSYIRLREKKSSSSDTNDYDFKNDDSDDVNFYLKPSGSSVDYDEFKDEVEDGDKIGLITNSDDEVTRVYIISSSSSGDDEDDGEISSISDDDLKLSGVSTKFYIDDPDDVDVDVDDGEETIKDYDDLVEAVDEDRKTAEVTITYDDDNYVTKIEGQITQAKGDLQSIDTDDRIIKLKFNSGNTTEYEYKSNVKIDLRYYSEDEEGLEKAVDNESSDERMITIEINSNNIVTSIESTEI